MLVVRRSSLASLAVGLVALAALVHCGSSDEAGQEGESGGASSGEPVGGGSSSSGGSTSPDAGPADASSEPENVAERPSEAGFVTEVVSFTPGKCAGFGASSMPGVLHGGPRGAGTQSGGFDVVSLGTGGEIVLGFAPLRIVDEPGPDFIVFENVFYANDDPARPFRELAEVSVSADGETWHTFPCGGDAGNEGCAGRSPVHSAPGNGISPTDPAAAGGDAFDLAALDVTLVRFVRIRDVGTQACAGGSGPGSNGFDLDAVAVVHGALLSP